MTVEGCGYHVPCGMTNPPADARPALPAVRHSSPPARRTSPCRSSPEPQVPQPQVVRSGPKAMGEGGFSQWNIWTSLNHGSIWPPRGTPKPRSETPKTTWFQVGESSVARPAHAAAHKGDPAYRRGGWTSRALPALSYWAHGCVTLCFPCASLVLLVVCPRYKQVKNCRPLAELWFRTLECLEQHISGNAMP